MQAERQRLRRERRLRNQEVSAKHRLHQVERASTALQRLLEAESKRALNSAHAAALKKSAKARREKREVLRQNSQLRVRRRTWFFDPRRTVEELVSGFQA